MSQFTSLLKNNKSMILALLFFVIGGGYFLVNWPYAEGGQGILFMIYMGLCVVLAIKELHVVKIIPVLAVILCAGVIGYASQKFEWRKNYILNSQNGDYFVLDQYIEKYPTFEDVLFGSLTGQPNYIGFANDCYKPALNNQAVGQQCRSVNLINSKYNIDINVMIDTHYKLMQKTAQLFERERIQNKRQYAQCIQNKECALIPLLPTSADIEQVSQDKDAYIDIRRQFWSLLDKENRFITPEICEFMELCRVMRDANIVSIAKPEAESVAEKEESADEE